MDDFDTLNVLPVEVKSGKDYRIHASLDRFMSNDEYGIPRAIVFGNEREIRTEGKLLYMPVYYSMFLKHPNGEQGELILPEL